MSNWKERPTTITEINADEATHVLYIDENGDTNMKVIAKAKLKNEEVSDNNKYFCLTSVLVPMEENEKIRENIKNIKFKYWKDGLYENKRVCFHSEDIRHSKGAFSNNCLRDNREQFMIDLTSTMAENNVTIVSSFINKEKLYDTYTYYGSPYFISCQFIFERIVQFCTHQDAKIIIIFESRGAKEDNLLHKDVMNLISSGTRYCDKMKMSKIIGVYFNKKRTTDNQSSFYGLELADLYSFPIYKYCKKGLKELERPLDSYIYKLHGYPNFKGCGLKVFP